MTGSWFVPDTGTGDKVYIRDKEYGWLPGTVVETENHDLAGKNDPRALVRIELPASWTTATICNQDYDNVAKKEQWVSLKDYPKLQLPLQNEGVACRDMAELPHLHEAAILYQVKERHAQHKPYTRVSEIVVAVNPCEWISDLYSEEEQRMYAENFVWKALDQDGSGEEKKDDSVHVASSTSFKSSFDRLGYEPHVYEASALAYRGLVQDRTDQTILVSGESGAGKTETVKIVLQHLATMEHFAPAQMKDRKGKRLATASDDLVKHIVESSSLFEAFGNAKTFSNDNSSRFGKVTRLQFHYQPDNICGLQGSTCETCLLETSRVVSHVAGERSFHIFYQLLAAPSLVKADLLGLGWGDLSVDDFKLLNHSGACRPAAGTSDSDMWTQTMKSLEFFDWKGDSLRTLLRALGVILQLGNLTFEETEDGHAKVSSREDLDSLAEAIGIPAELLEVALTWRVIKTAQEQVEVPLDAESAKDVCDALIKKTYSVIFDSVVRRVNFLTNAPTSSEACGTISMVDLFGFESFEVNRFEQLCINYVNEKMQHKYVQDNLRRYKAEYKEEGIELFDYKLVDNSDILQLLEGRTGIIDSLNEESVRPRGSNETFVYKIKKAHESNDRLISKKLHTKVEFCISHFAGPVTYNAAAFVERNTDKLPEDLMYLTATASNALIAAEFKRLTEERAEKETAEGNRKKAAVTTVLENFRSQLRSLMASMEGGQTRYIRCIKPNTTMTPKVIDHVAVLRQLQCAGVVTATDLSRETFPNKLTYDHMEERFSCLLDADHRYSTKDMELYDKVHLMVSNLFAPLIAKYGDVNFCLPFACGKTKIYFRSGGLESLETMRHEYYSEKATVLQQWVRKVKLERQYGHMRCAVIRIQAVQRGHLVRSACHRTHEAATPIQAWTRCSVVRRRYQQMKIKQVVLSAWVRSALSLDRYHQMKLSVVVLQAWSRSRLDSSRFNRLRLAVLTLQTRTRAYPDRARFQTSRAAAITLQTRARMNLAKETARRYEQEALVEKATRNATTIQIWWRAVDECRAKAHKQRELAKFAAVKVWWQERQESAALVIQFWLGARMERIRFQRKQTALMIIQKWHRAVATQETKERIEFKHKRCASLFVQAWYRKIAGEKDQESKQQRAMDERALVHIQGSFKTHTLVPNLDFPSMGFPSTGSLVDQRSTTLTVYDDDHASRKTFRPTKEHEAEIGALRNEIEQVTTEAELHLQECQADFEDKLIDYEDEVLHLNRTLRIMQQEKQDMQEDMSASKQNHEMNIHRLKKGMQRTHESHKEYLGKVMGAIEVSSEARRAEAERIMREVDYVRQEKDSKIQALEDELALLRNLGVGADPTQDQKPNVSSRERKASQFTKKMEELLSAENVMEVVTAAQRNPGPTVPYIDKKLSFKGRLLMEDMAGLVTDQAAGDRSAKDRKKIKYLKQQLGLAHEEMTSLRNQVEQGSPKAGGMRKRLFGRKET